MNSPFDKRPQGAKDGFNPFLGKPQGPVATGSFEKAKATKRDNTRKLVNWLSEFSSKSPKKDALLAEIAANRPPEESELVDVLDALDRPDAVTVNQIVKTALEMGAFLNLANWLCDRDNRRSLPHRFTEVGYEPVRNEGDKITGGLWVIGGRRQVIYAKKDLPRQEQIRAAMTLRKQLGNRGPETTPASKIGPSTNLAAT